MTAAPETGVRQAAGTDEPPESDASIIERSWDEPEAFAELFDRYAEDIHRYAARRVGAEVADDLMAEAFVVAFQRRRRYDVARPQARPWLYGIATNLVHDHRRAEARRLRALSRVAAAAPDDWSGGGEPMAEQVAARVSAATVAAGVGGSAVVASTRGGAAPSRPGGAPSGSIPAVSVAEVLHKAADRTRSSGGQLPIPRNDQYFCTRTFTTRTLVDGGRTRTWTDESWLSVDGSKPSRREELGKVHDDPPLGKHEVPSLPTEYAQWKKWPTDPDTLYRWLGGGSKVVAADPKGSSSTEPAPDPDSQVYMEACLMLKGPRVMPPGLQAALFEVLAKLHRIKLDDDQVDALGRHGIGVAYPHLSFGLVFDRSTYDYLGLRQWSGELKLIKGKWQQVGGYTEVTALEKVGVVDRIGQRP